MKSAPRVVLETNVVLSALLFSRGRLAWLRDAWHSRRVVPLLSHDTASELVSVLQYPKFRLSAPEQQELLADVLPYCTVVRLPKRLPKVPACRDPGDVPFLQLAAAGNARYLVTGDRDLLSVRVSMPFRIVAPADLLEELGPG
jgi:uncharacterized protein